MFGFFEGIFFFGGVTFLFVCLFLAILFLGVSCVFWAMMTDTESKGGYFSDLQNEK